jgi:UDP-N-acetylmuramate: L-alanyl-gamma-D-glutamyl-meso-diaminopimelate ligase
MERGIEVQSMARALAEQVLARRKPLVVTGTHGKTTTSALLAHLLRQVGVDAGFFLGGIPLNFERSSRLGAEGAPFVIEGDEYDSAFFEKVPKFWSYRPSAAILTSIEYDHVDIFGSEEAYVGAFRRFVELIPQAGQLFAWAGDPLVREVAAATRCKVRFYALDGDECGDIEPTWVGRRGPGGTLDLFHAGSACGHATVPMIGRHNVRNAVAALAMASEAAGAPLQGLLAALGGFRGTRRRQELVGTTNGVRVYDDFAHHPTAVHETLSGFREHVTGRLIAVFEPRSATASRRLHQDMYPDAFAPADVCILAPVGRSEIPAKEKLDTIAIAEAITSRGRRARACSSVEEVVQAATTEAQSGDTIVVMSNGRFDDAPDRILRALGGR